MKIYVAFVVDKVDGTVRPEVQNRVAELEHTLDAERTAGAPNPLEEVYHELKSKFLAEQSGMVLVALTSYDDPDPLNGGIQYHQVAEDIFARREDLAGRMGAVVHFNVQPGDYRKLAFKDRNQSLEELSERIWLQTFRAAYRESHPEIPEHYTDKQD